MCCEQYYAFSCRLAVRDRDREQQQRGECNMMRCYTEILTCSLSLSLSLSLPLCLSVCVYVYMYMTQVWGINSGRTRAAADLLASTGDYVVVVPDLYYDEDTIDNHGGLDPFPVEWVKKFTPERLTTDVEIVRTALTTELIDGGKAGIIGFCWGAFVVFECCQKKDSFSAGVSMHPSIQIAGIFGHSPVQLAEGVTCPQLLLPAGNDQEADKPGGDVIVALQKLPGIGDACKSHVFPEMVHGWVPRGDVSEPAIARDVDLAMKMTKDFLDTHLL